MVMSDSTEQGKPAPWFDWIEKATLAGAVGGTVVSALTQQMLFVSVPLSLAAVLGFMDRQRMTSQINQNHEFAVQKTEFLAANADAMTQIQMIQHNKTHNLAVECIDRLQSQVKALQEQAETMLRKQEELLGSTFEEGYYRRGLEYEAKGEFKAAISAYDEALRLNPSYAIAFMQRGLASANLGQRQQAIADLRTATKMFFESGDLENYHRARTLSEDVHGGQPAVTAASQARGEERIAVDELFV